MSEPEGPRQPAGGAPPGPDRREGPAQDETVPIPEVRAASGSSELEIPEAHPRHVGPYKILEVLGQGGMGVVYLADQTRPVQRRVALKLIKLGMDTKEVIARFESERQALAMMDHPFIARVFDAGTMETGRPYFVMEHVQGLPITKYCDTHRLSTRERLHLFGQVCDAIQHAHQKGIIHRDVKPSNLLVTVPNGGPVVKVIDFGVARATNQRLTERTLFTEQGRIIGTPEYMSPEQAEMSSLDVDTRTDIYSLGVVLYELLVGTLPFDMEKLRRAGLDELRRKIRNTEPPSPSTRLRELGVESMRIALERRTVPTSLRRLLEGDLDWITMKAMEKDRTRRYATASELAADLVRHVRDEPVLARPPSTTYRLGKFVRKHRGLVAGLCTLLVVLLAAVAVSRAQYLRAERLIWAAEQAEKDAREALAAAEAAREEEQRERGVAAGAVARADASVRMTKSLEGLLERVIRSMTPQASGAPADYEGLLDGWSDAIEEHSAHSLQATAALRGTLGRTYMELGRYGKAEPHLRWALETRQMDLGEGHPDTLESRHDMGILLMRLGKARESVGMLRRVLDARRRTLGEGHEDTLRAATDLAESLMELGNLDEAAELHQQTLEARRWALGDNHPLTLASLNAAGVCAHRQGKGEEAEKLIRRALEVRERTLGEEHVDTHRSRMDLAAVLLDQARPDDADPLSAKALDGLRDTLGADHPDTLRAGYLRARVLEGLGRLAEARSLHREVLEGRRAVLGEGRIETARSAEALAEIAVAEGRLIEAETLYMKVLEIQTRVLSRQHQETLLTRSDLGEVLRRSGKLQAAEILARETLEAAGFKGRRQDGWDRNWYRSCYGRILVDLERYDEAERHLREGYRGLKRALGADDERCRKVLRMLVDLYAAWGKPEKAREYRIQLPRSEASANGE